MFCYVLDFIILVVHGHGRGALLGTCLVQHQCVLYTIAFAACVNAEKCSVMFLISLHLLCTGMDEARALVHALCSSSVSRISLLCSMFECFNVLVGCRHAQGMRLSMRLVYATCGVAFISSVTGARWRCPKTCYIHKQLTRTIQNSNFLLQITSNKHARLQ